MKRTRSAKQSTTKQEPPEKKQKSKTGEKIKQSIESSSESDIENYLLPVDKVDLNSSFFRIEKPEKPISPQPSDSESDNEPETKEEPRTKFNFDKLHEYTKKLEETKKHIEEYNRKKQVENSKTDILNLLAKGEAKTDANDVLEDCDFHSSDFQSGSDSEKEWEEVQAKEKEPVLPKEGLQITVEMPNAIRKKKGVDLMAAMKRRLNRIRKENQVYVHKVHLLCWLAHGNYVNAILNSEQILGLSLSLLPSEKCYPPERTDLQYLEQILQWFKKTVKLAERPEPKELSFGNLLQLQVTKKEAFSKKMLVYVFISILRSLGIHVRLVLSLQVEPLRPPNSELCSLSTKPEKNKAKTSKTKKESPEEKVDMDKKATEANKPRLKSDSHVKFVEEIKNEGKSRVRFKSTASQEVTEDKTEERKLRLRRLGSQNAKSEDKKAKPKEKSDKSSKQSEENKKEEKTKTESGKSETPKRKLRLRNFNEIKDNAKKADKVMEKIPSEKVASKDTNKSGKTAKPKETQKNIKNRRSKSTSDNLVAKEAEMKTRSKSTSDDKAKIKIKLRPKPKSKKPIPQIDGISHNISDTEDSDIESDDSDLFSDSEWSSDSDDWSSEMFYDSDWSSDSECCSDSELFSPSDSNDSEIAQLDGARKKAKSKTQQTTDDDFQPKTPVVSNKRNSPSTSKFFPTNQADVRNDIVKIIKGRIAEQNPKKKKESDSDSDYLLEESPKKTRRESADEFLPKTKVKQRISVNKRKVLSSDSETESNSQKMKGKKKGIDVWAEVFLETEEKWISVDVVHGQLHCVNELYTRASHPVSYIIGWNNDNTLKDVTKRYCHNFNTTTRKLRVDPNWWQDSLKAFLGPNNARNKEEDDELERQQMEKPLPTSIAEYKNHPLYVLKRHLLKFEAIYPPDAPSLGFVRKEPVYSRQCVYTCHSRDIWLKHAKVVKIGEKPYKIVKARPKYDKLSNTVVTDQMLEIFGPWQTEDYVPPTAENGVVPRNAFGNVELFKPCMLPKKTVHLQLPGLNKVAKRMNIDCASAIVGFDFHGGWSHPTYDGFVVCEEYEDALVAAWELDREEMAKREQEKIEKRVYDNWRKLIKGLLIRERLKAKYNFGNSEDKSGKGKKKKLPRMQTKKRRIVSDDESESD